MGNFDALADSLQIPNEVIRILKGMGYGGVDIFMFASGVGCFYSLERNSDCFEFIKRRVIRIVPTYWIFLVGWALYKRIFFGMGGKTILGNFLCVRNFTGLGGDFNWYISAMWLMYLLAPFFKGAVDRTNSIYKIAFFAGVLILFSICFWNVDTYIITMTRLPIFFIGMYVGKLAWNDAYISKMSIVGLWISAGMGVCLYFYWKQNNSGELWGKGYYWYPFILITPGLCVLISFFMDFLKCILGKVGEWIEKILMIPGKYSFEIYLLHIWFFDILTAVCEKYGIWEVENKVWILIILAVFPVSVVLRYLTKIVIGVGTWILKRKDG